MPAPVVANMLGTMRDHLGALQAIVRALGDNDPQQAATIAEQRLGMSAMQGPRHHEQLRFMPEGMRQIGARMHKLAGAFAIAARNSEIDGDRQAPLKALNAVTAQCAACHATYRLTEMTSGDRSTSKGGPKGASVDSRTSLHMTPGERAAFLADMRVMLGSVRGILHGVAEQDRGAIVRAAKRSGNRMSRNVPASIRAKLPKAFQKIGAPTHLAFEEIAIRAETDPLDEITALTARTMNHCMACHASFRTH